MNYSYRISIYTFHRKNTSFSDIKIKKLIYLCFFIHYQFLHENNRENTCISNDYLFGFLSKKQRREQGGFIG